MEDKSVRGHMCEGLRKYQEYSTISCIPSFTEGCDDTNYVPILICPFCGERLPEPKKYKHICDCGHEWESYLEDDICNECYECVDGKELVELK